MHTTEDAELARIMAPLTEEEAAAGKAAYLALGVPENVWLALHPDNRRVACTHFRNSGRFMDVLNTTLPFQRDAPLVKVPPELAPVWSRFTSIQTHTYFCVTQGEEWWPLERAFLADTPAKLLQLCVYVAIKFKGDRDFLRHLQKRGPGRPADPRVALRKQEEELYKQEYKAWREVCDARKEIITRLHNDYKEAMARAEELRLAWKEAEAERAPPMPQRHP